MGGGRKEKKNPRNNRYLVLELRILENPSINQVQSGKVLCYPEEGYPLVFCNLLTKLSRFYIWMYVCEYPRVCVCIHTCW